MKHKSLTLSALALAVISGAAVRIWFLQAAIDSLGLPANDHPSVHAFAVISIFFTLVFLLLSIKSPGRGIRHTVLTFSPIQQLLSLAAAVLLALGAAFSLTAGTSTAQLVLAILGIGAAVCMGITARNRKKGNQVPLPELIPVVYLIVKLILNFKDWSVDPIIMDYCHMLFALIFTLLAFYFSAGFLFDKGQSRKTLFCATVACVFCPMAAVDGVFNGDLSTVFAYSGYFLWMAAMIPCLLVPREAAKKPETNEPTY